MDVAYSQGQLLQFSVPWRKSGAQVLQLCFVQSLHVEECSVGCVCFQITAYLYGLLWGHVP